MGNDVSRQCVAYGYAGWAIAGERSGLAIGFWDSRSDLDEWAESGLWPPPAMQLSETGISGRREGFARNTSSDERLANSIIQSF